MNFDQFWKSVNWNFSGVGGFAHKWREFITEIIKENEAFEWIWVKIHEKQLFLNKEIENRTPRKASFPVRIWSFFMWTRGNPKKKTPHTIQTILGFFFFNGKWLFFREKLNFFGYFPGRKRNFRKGWIVWGVFFLGSVRMIRGSHGSWADSMVSKAEILFNFLLIKTIENLFWS